MSKILFSHINRTDSYKTSHWLQYPPGSEYVSSYIEPRGLDINLQRASLNNVEIVNFGLQIFLKEYLQRRITIDDINMAEKIYKQHGVPFNRTGWIDILKKFGGLLPVHVQALPEGTIFSPRTAQVQVMNTHPDFYWLTSYIETALIRSVWYPSTVATISREVKKNIYKFLQDTCDNPDDEIGFKLHDFGARGVSSAESAGLGGAAHIVNFLGTDTVEGMLTAMKYYNLEDVPAFSIPASEHSTITAWGRENEAMAYKNMLDQYGGPNKLVACVSDSYNIYDAVNELWGRQLKEDVKNMGGTLVIRPDSGDPKTVVMAVLQSLESKFGTTINNKGFKVLNPCVRVIQGDGVNPLSINEILHTMKNNGFSAENIVFGMGGALLQKLDRDTLSYAMKANAIRINGKWQDVYKEPVDMQSKSSKRGRLAVIKDPNDKLVTIREDELKGRKNQLVTVFKDGNIVKEWDFDEVRENAKIIS